MHFRLFRRVGRHQSARPSGRYLWTARGLLIAAAVLIVWAGASIVDARQAPPTSAAPSADTVAADKAGSRRLRRILREQRPLIEPPLQDGSGPFRRAGVAVQKPVSGPEPVSIAIPRIGVDQDLIELAVIGNSLQVPNDYSDIGWWRDGPVPGQRGAAVVVGHVDSPTSPAVFYQLSGLTDGDRITVKRDDGVRVVFEVADVQVYERTQFPSREVYRSGGKPALHLLTCGGSFDPEAGEYTSNVVVYAPLVKRNRAAATAKGEGDRPGRPQTVRRGRR